MRGLLVRVGADQSAGGGHWNGLVDSDTGEFVYVAIPEAKPVLTGCDRPYAALAKNLSPFAGTLPMHLIGRGMHLDPDFDYLTYGDQGRRARQIEKCLGPGDLLVFYAGLRAVQMRSRLVYALIGLFVIDEIVPADQVPEERRDENAHTRRKSLGSGDIVVRGRQDVSGRLERAVPIGSFRTAVDAPYKRPCYRVDSALLDAWGGLNNKDGYLQRSANLPSFADADRFYRWFKRKGVPLVAKNNPVGPLQ